MLAVFKIFSIMLAPCDKVRGVHSLRERFAVHHTNFHARVFGVRKIHLESWLPFTYQDIICCDLVTWSGTLDPSHLHFLR
jgi:hypothetical protein